MHITETQSQVFLQKIKKMSFTKAIYLFKCLCFGPSRIQLLRAVFSADSLESHGVHKHQKRKPAIIISHADRQMRADELRLKTSPSLWLQSDSTQDEVMHPLPCAMTSVRYKLARCVSKFTLSCHPLRWLQSHAAHPLCISTFSWLFCVV